MACMTFSSPVEGGCAVDHHSKLRLWSVWHASQFSSPLKQPRKPYSRTLVACNARVSESPTSQEIAQDRVLGEVDVPMSAQDADSQAITLASQPMAIDSPVKLPPPVLETPEPEEEPEARRFSEDLKLLADCVKIIYTGSSAGVMVSNKPEKEVTVGFPGAKGATIQPLTAKELAHFPQGYLEETRSIDKWDWVTVVPMDMLPKGDRLVFSHNKESVLLFWFQEKIYAIENRSPTASTFKDGFTNAEITEEGHIVCPVTQSTFDIRTGAAVKWFPNDLLTRTFMPVFCDLSVYSVKACPSHVFIEKKCLLRGGFYPLAEFTGNRLTSDPNYEKPLIFDDLEALEFGFTPDNEIANGRAAMLGFLTLLLFEMTTGEGFLKAFGFLDYLYQFLPDFPILRY